MADTTFVSGTVITKEWLVEYNAVLNFLNDKEVAVSRKYSTQLENVS